MSDLIQDLGVDEKQGIRIQFSSSYHPTNPNLMNRAKEYLPVGSLLFFGNKFLLVCPNRYNFFSSQFQPILPILITAKPGDFEFIRRRNCIRIPLASFIIKPLSIQIDFWDSPNQEIRVNAVLKLKTKDNSDTDKLLGDLQRILM